METLIWFVLSIVAGVTIACVSFAWGKSEGRDEMCREIDRFYRSERQRRAW